MIDNFSMKNLFKIFLPVTAVAALCLPSHALEVVYPKTVSLNINAASTFFVGNTETDSILTINKKPVKVWENGSFVEVVPLADGENLFVLESTKGTDVKTVTYSINKAPKSSAVKEEAPLEEFPSNEYIYAMTIADNTPLRAQPDDNAKRVTHLDKDTVLMVNGKKGNWFRVSLSPDTTVWVDSTKVANCSIINEKLMATISDVSISDDKYYEYIKNTVDFKVPFKITEIPGGLEIELYCIKTNAADNKIFKPQTMIKNVAIATTETNRTSKYFVELNNKLWGYDAYYEGTNLVIKIRKAPKIDAEHPLKGITIAVDPGHGGADSGSVGPTGIAEKTLNLDVALKLKQELENSGATVYMTRCDDTNTPLYDRPKNAKKADALFMVSIHANALPDGADPYKKHGTAAFYYNEETKELAGTIQTQMIQDLGTKDDGLNRTSFVLTRPTMPLCTLIEVAYMIHPTEYTLMLDENFRQKAAVSIKKGIEKYLLNNKDK